MKNDCKQHLWFSQKQQDGLFVINHPTNTIDRTKLRILYAKLENGNIVQYTEMTDKKFNTSDFDDLKYVGYGSYEKTDVIDKFDTRNNPSHKEETKNETNNSLDDLFKFIILFPLGISVFSWFGIGMDVVVDYLYSFFKHSELFKDIFELSNSLYSVNTDNPLIPVSDNKMQVVTLILVSIYLPISLILYAIVTFIKTKIKVVASSGKAS